jgi:hypothetical protein
MLTTSSPLPAVTGPKSERFFADPVFVLCNGRSGSTLLRFLLDAHPDLACPPETNLPDLCAHLATVWSLIGGAPLSENRGDEPPVIPDGAIAGVRETVDRMMGSYLERRAKNRYCDKSLDTARYAELLTRIYPQARFICLYRHPMDVIASGVEACPWGLSGYGFDSYIASTPGNAVLALARFWADNAATTLAAEESFPDHCLRVRYEDLTTDPEGTAAGIFGFLGVEPAPGVSRACFSGERERFGPADHKIWCTSAVSSGSVGRGLSVPTGMIAPPVLAGINELAGKLGYLQVDDGWGTSAPPSDLRVVLGSGGEASGAAGAAEVLAASAHSGELADRLRAGLVSLRAGDVGGQEGDPAETFVAVWIPSEPGDPAEHRLVDLKAETVTLAGSAAQQDSDWDVVGSAEAWEQVLAGRPNLSVALRSCQLRYCDGAESQWPVGDQRIRLLGAMLGIAGWTRGTAAQPAGATGNGYAAGRGLAPWPVPSACPPSPSPLTPTPASCPRSPASPPKTSPPSSARPLPQPKRATWPGEPATGASRRKPPRQGRAMLPAGHEHACHGATRQGPGQPRGPGTSRRCGPEQYTSIAVSERLAAAGAQTSVGTVGDAFENALAESAIGLYKTELIKSRGPWRTADQVELATLDYVDWFSRRRLFEICGDIPPAGLEGAYHRQDTDLPKAG